MPIKFISGKKPFKANNKDLKIENYYDPALIANPPLIYGHTSLIAPKGYGILGNDTAGDCGFAMADHRHLFWTTEGGNPAQFSTANTLEDYHDLSGYDPNDPSTDVGVQLRDLLAYNQKTGMLDAKGMRHFASIYSQIDYTNINLFKSVVSTFGCADLGIEFPDSAMTQFNAGKPWTVVRGAKNEGGHAILVIAYDTQYVYVITWGCLQAMTWEFFNKYVDESWLVFNHEFLKSGISPDGYDIATLNADYTALTGKTPPIDPVTPPITTDCKTSVENALVSLNLAEPLLKKSTSKFVVQAMPNINNALNYLNSIK